MKSVLFIAWQDVRMQLKEGSTLLWLLVMPPVFFFFIGTVTGGFAGSVSGEHSMPVTIVAENPGFLKDQFDLRLKAQEFDPEWVDALAARHGRTVNWKAILLGATFGDPLAQHLAGATRLTDAEGEYGSFKSVWHARHWADQRVTVWRVGDWAVDDFVDADRAEQGHAGHGIFDMPFDAI